MNFPALWDHQVFFIPAGDSDGENPSGDVKFNRDHAIVWLLPHMPSRSQKINK